MKFYFVSLTHRTLGLKLHKFGVTKSKDVLDRFNSTTYPEREKYKDFIIKVLYSIYSDNEENILRLENLLLNTYTSESNLIDINRYFFKEPDFYNYKNLSGITEIRHLNHNEVKDVFNILPKKG